MSQQILMIEDDEHLARMVVEYLGDAGLQVDHCATATLGIERLRSGHFDALLLDVMLPDLDGFEVCRQIRADNDIPILMLTARGDEMDRIVGLELGADDYLPKPFNPRELLARLKAVLRRRPCAPHLPGDRLRYGALEIDLAERQVRLNGEACDLTGHQFGILRVLAENAGRVLSRETLMNHVRGDSLDVYDRSIDVHISRIRAAIESNPRRPRRIITVRGAGYVFARNQEA